MLATSSVNQSVPHSVLAMDNAGNLICQPISAPFCTGRGQSVPHSVLAIDNADNLICQPINAPFCTGHGQCWQPHLSPNQCSILYWPWTMLATSSVNQSVPHSVLAMDNAGNLICQPISAPFCTGRGQSVPHSVLAIDNADNLICQPISAPFCTCHGQCWQPHLSTNQCPILHCYGQC